MVTIGGTLSLSSAPLPTLLVLSCCFFFLTLIGAAKCLISLENFSSVMESRTLSHLTQRWDRSNPCAARGTQVSHLNHTHQNHPTLLEHPYSLLHIWHLCLNFAQHASQFIPSQQISPSMNHTEFLHSQTLGDMWADRVPGINGCREAEDGL